MEVQYPFYTQGPEEQSQLSVLPKGKLELYGWVKGSN